MFDIVTTEPQTNVHFVFARYACPYHNNICIAHSGLTAGCICHRQPVPRCLPPALGPQLQARCMFALCRLGNHCSSAPVESLHLRIGCGVGRGEGLTDRTRTGFDARSDSYRLRMERIWRGTLERPMRLICYYIPTTVAADMAMYAYTLARLHA